MKYTWEPRDIIAGRIVDSYNRTEQYIIGYEVGTSDDRLLLVSLTDGMIFTKGHTEESMAEYLNERENNRGGFRPTDIRKDDCYHKEEKS